MPIIQPSNTDPAGLGPVPTLGGDLSTNTPSTPTATTPTTVQQGNIATAQETQQAVFLPPAPTPTPITGTEMLTAPWVIWFQTLNRKLGGYATQYLAKVAKNVPLAGDGTATSPLTLPVATATSDGYLAHADWATFNGKQAALGFTPAPITRALNTTAPLTGGGDLSADRTFAMPAATALVDGYLKATDWAIFNGKQNAIGTYTVATLPAASVGLRAFVTDANATTFASIVAGGGTNKIPVYSDGTNWRIG